MGDNRKRERGRTGQWTRSHGNMGEKAGMDATGREKDRER